MNKILTEVDILLVTVEEAEKYAGNLFSKYEFIQYKNDSLISMVGDSVTCHKIFDSAIKRLKVPLSFSYHQIRKGYSINDFCKDILQVIKKRKVSNTINLYKPTKTCREKVIDNDDIMSIIIDLNICGDVLEFINKI